MAKHAPESVTALAPLFRSRSQLVAATIAVVLLGGIGFLPLFGGPGYEAALAAGLVLPALGAVATAVEVASARPAPLDAYGRGLLSGFRLALLALLVTLAHGFRVGFCDPWDDIALFALGPGVGAVMGAFGGGMLGQMAGQHALRKSADTLEARVAKRGEAQDDLQSDEEAEGEVQVALNPLELPRRDL